ncbi:MAG: metal-sulfur cluster assembly factor [Bdellovibrionota bacterium]
MEANQNSTLSAMSSQGNPTGAPLGDSPFTKLTDEALKEWLRPVQDPELFLSIVDLGLIYNCENTESGKVEVKMTLTSPGCPAGGYMVDQVQKKLMEHPEVQEVKVDIVWEPKWDPKTMASDEVKERLGIW